MADGKWSLSSGSANESVYAYFTNTTDTAATFSIVGSSISDSNLTTVGSTSTLAYVTVGADSNVSITDAKFFTGLDSVYLTNQSGSSNYTLAIADSISNTQIAFSDFSISSESVGNFYNSGTNITYSVTNNTVQSTLGEVAVQLKGLAINSKDTTKVKFDSDNSIVSLGSGAYASTTAVTVSTWSSNSIQFSDATKAQIEIEALASNVSLSASSGDDTITIGGTTSGGAVSIDGGAGNDTFTIKSTVSSSNTLAVYGGAGSDTYTFDANVSIGGMLLVSDTQDANTFNISNGLKFGDSGTLSAVGGAGADTFKISGVTAGENSVVALEGGGGNDIFEIANSTNISIKSSSEGSDTLKIDMTSNVGIYLSGFDNNDYISLSAAATSGAYDSSTKVFTLTTSANKALTVTLDADSSSDTSKFYSVSIKNGENESLLGDIIDPFVWGTLEGGIIYGRRNDVSVESPTSGLFSISGANATPTSGAISGITVDHTASTVTITDASLLNTSSTVVMETLGSATNGYHFVAPNASVSNTLTTDTFKFETSSGGTIEADVYGQGTKVTYSLGSGDSYSIVPNWDAESKTATFSNLLDAASGTGKVTLENDTITIGSDSFASDTLVSISKNTKYDIIFNGGTSSQGAYVSVAAAALAGGKSLMGGDGADTIQLGSDATVTTSATIGGGAGNDSIVLSKVTIDATNGGLVVDGGAGSNAFLLDTVTGNSKLTINASTDSSNDTITIKNSTNLTITSGASDSDTIAFNTSAASGIYISGFNSQDVISLSGAVTSGSVGADNKTLVLGAENAVSISLDATVTADLYKATVKMGDDTVSLLGNIVDPYIWSTLESENSGKFKWGRGTLTTDTLFSVEGFATNVAVSNGSIEGVKVTVDGSSSQVSIGAASVLSTAGATLNAGESGYTFVLAENLTTKSSAADWSLSTAAEGAATLNASLIPVDTEYTFATLEGATVIGTSLEDSFASPLILGGINTLAEGTAYSSKLTVGTGNDSTKVTVGSDLIPTSAIALSAGDTATPYSITFGGAANVDVSLRNGTITGSTGADTFTFNVEGANTIDGTNGLYIDGGSGSDTFIIGTAAADSQGKISLVGGDGDDKFSLMGAAAVSIQSGASDNDSLIFSDSKAASVTVNNFNASDVIVWQGATLGAQTTTSLFSTSASGAQLSLGSNSYNVINFGDASFTADSLYAVKVYNGSTAESTTALGDIINPYALSTVASAEGATGSVAGEYVYGRYFTSSTDSLFALEGFNGTVAPSTSSDSANITINTETHYVTLSGNLSDLLGNDGATITSKDTSNAYKFAIATDNTTAKSALTAVAWNIASSTNATTSASLMAATEASSTFTVDTTGTVIGTGYEGNYNLVLDGIASTTLSESLFGTGESATVVSIQAGVMSGSTPISLSAGNGTSTVEVNLAGALNVYDNATNTKLIGSKNDDTIQIGTAFSDATFAATVTVDAGAGNDSINLSGLTLGGSGELDVTLGAGKDTVYLKNVSTGTSGKISLISEATDSSDTFIFDGAASLAISGLDSTDAISLATAVDASNSSYDTSTGMLVLGNNISINTGLAANVSQVYALSVTNGTSSTSLQELIDPYTWSTLEGGKYAYGRKFDDAILTVEGFASGLTIGTDGTLANVTVDTSSHKVEIDNASVLSGLGGATLTNAESATASYTFEIEGSLTSTVDSWNINSTDAIFYGTSGTAVYEVTDSTLITAEMPDVKVALSGVNSTVEASLFSAKNTSVTIPTEAIAENSTITVKTGAGYSINFASAANVVVGDTNTSIIGSSGADTFSLSEDVASAESGSVYINGGDGDDTFNIEKATVKGGLSLVGGAGTNSFNLSTVDGVYVNASTASSNDTFTINSGTNITILSGNDSDTIAFDVTNGGAGVSIGGTFNTNDKISLSSAAENGVGKSKINGNVFELYIDDSKTVSISVASAANAANISVKNGESEVTLGEMATTYVWETLDGGVVRYGSNTDASASISTGIFSISGLNSETTLDTDNHTIAGVSIEKSTVTISDAKVLGTADVVLSKANKNDTYKLTLSSDISSNTLEANAATWKVDSVTAAYLSSNTTLNYSVSSDGLSINTSYTGEDIKLVGVTKNAAASLFTNSTAEGSSDVTLAKGSYSSSTEVTVATNKSHNIIFGDVAAKVKVTDLNNSGSITGSSNNDTINVAGTSTVDSANVYIDGGAGNDRISLAGASISGTVTLMGGTGNDSIVLNNSSSLKGALTIEAGEGNDSIAIGGAKATNSATFDVGITINTGAGSDTVTVASATIGGNVSLVGDAVASSVTTNADTFSFASVSVGGNVVVEAGSSNDKITISNSSIDSGLTIDGGWGADSISVSGSTIGGGASIVGGTDTSSVGADVITFSNVSIGGETDGTLKIEAGIGNDKVSISTAKIDAGLTIDGGAGADSISVNGATVGGGISIDAGSTDSVTTSLAADIVNLNNVSVGGSDGTVNIAVGKGDDKVTISNASIGGAVTILAGEGNDSVSISGSSIGGAVTIDGAEGDDKVTISSSTITGDLTIDGGAGADSISVNGATLGGDVVIKGDTLDSNATTSADVITFSNVSMASGKSLTISAGASNDKVNISSATINGLTIDGGWGADSISVSGATIGGGVSIDSGSDSVTTSLAADIVNLNNVSVGGSDGTVNIAVGKGDDKVTISNATLDAAVTIDAGEGNDAVSVSGAKIGAGATISATSGNNRFDLANSTVASAVAISGGTDSDTFVISNTSIAGTAASTINVGNGVNAVSISTATLDGGATITGGTAADTFYINKASLGGATIDAGAGANNISLIGATVTTGSDTSIVGGAGIDNVIINSSSLGGALTIDVKGTGEGAATANTISLASTTIVGAATITGDKGQDDITFNNVHSASSDSTITISAGDGANTFTVKNSSLAGAVTINGGKDVDVITVSDKSSLAGGLYTSLGAGADKVTITTATLGGATINVGLGADSVSLSSALISGNVSIDASESTDTKSTNLFALDAVTISAATTTDSDDNTTQAINNTVTITGGKAADTINISGKTSIGVATTIDAGDGADKVSIAGTSSNKISVSADVNIVAGDGKDSINLSYVNFSAPTVAEGATVTTADLTINAGTGPDSITIENATLSGASITGAGTAASDSLTVNLSAISGSGAVSIAGATGNDKISVSKVTITGDSAGFVIDGGAGNDNISVTSASLGGGATIGASSAGASDTITLSDVSIVGSASIQSAATTKAAINIDNITISASAATEDSSSTGSTDGATISGGAGGDALNISNAKIEVATTIDAGSGTNTISISTATLSGNATIKGGEGKDSITITNASLGSASIDENTNESVYTKVLIDGGAEANRISISGATLSGETTIQGGAGKDSIVVSNTKVLANTTITGGAGKDSIVVSNTKVLANTTITGGEEADSIVVSGLTFDTATTAAGASVIIKGDAGANAIAISSVTASGDNSVVIDATTAESADIVNVSLASGISIGSGENDSDTFIFNGKNTVSLGGFDSSDKISLATAIDTAKAEFATETLENAEGEEVTVGYLVLGDNKIYIDGANELSKMTDTYEAVVYNGSNKATDTYKLGDLIDAVTWHSNVVSTNSETTEIEEDSTDTVTTFTYGRLYGSDNDKGLISISGGLNDTVTTANLSVTTVKTGTGNSATTVSVAAIAASMLGAKDVEYTVKEGYAVSLVGASAQTLAASWVYQDDKGADITISADPDSGEESTANIGVYKLNGSLSYVNETADSGGTLKYEDTRDAAISVAGLADATQLSLKGTVLTITSAAVGDVNAEEPVTIGAYEGSVGANYTYKLESATAVVALADSITITGSADTETGDTIIAGGEEATVKRLAIDGGAGDDVIDATYGASLTIDGGAGNDSILIDALTADEDSGITAAQNHSIKTGAGEDTVVINGAASIAITDLDAASDTLVLKTAVTAGSVSSLGVLTLGETGEDGAITGTVQISLGNVTSADASKLYGLKVYNGTADAEEPIVTLIEDLIDAKEWNSVSLSGGYGFTYGRQYGSEQNLISIGSGLVVDTSAETSLSGVITALTGKTSTAANEEEVEITTVTIGTDLLSSVDVAYTTKSSLYTVAVVGDEAKTGADGTVYKTLGSAWIYGTTTADYKLKNEEGATVAGQDNETIELLGDVAYSVVAGTNGGTITATDVRRTGIGLSGLASGKASLASLNSETESQVDIAAGAIGSTRISVTAGEGYNISLGGTKNNTANLFVSDTGLTITGNAAADTITFASNLVSLAGNTLIEAGNGNNVISLNSGITGTANTAEDAAEDESLVASTNGITINAGTGSDTVTVSNVASIAAINVGAGDGANKVEIGSVTAVTEVSVTTGVGADTINLSSIVGGVTGEDDSATIGEYSVVIGSGTEDTKTDKGTDSITLTNFASLKSVEVATDGGTHNDTVKASGFTDVTTLNIGTGLGNDVISLSSFAGGDVISIVSGDTDTGSDTITLSNIASINNITVDAGTGKATNKITLSTVTAVTGVAITTGGGNDTISLTSVSGAVASTEDSSAEAAATGITINSASEATTGSDTITLTNIASINNIQVNAGTGAGTNKVEINTVSAVTGIAITTGGGKDTLTLNSITGGEGTSGITVVSGTDDANPDSITLNNIASIDNIQVNTGEGTVKKNDTVSASNITDIGTLTVGAGLGNDSIYLNNVTGALDSEDALKAEVTIAGGAGSDTITISNISSINKLVVTSGDGEDSLKDTITLTNLASIGSATITGSAGADTINVTNVSAIGNGNFAVDGGAGNDVINISSITAGPVDEEDTVSGIFVVNGGEGNDTISITASTGISIVSGDEDKDLIVIDGKNSMSASITGYDISDTLKFSTAVTSGSIITDTEISTQPVLLFNTANSGAISLTVDKTLEEVFSDLYDASITNGSSVVALKELIDPNIYRYYEGEGDEPSKIVYGRGINTADSILAVEGIVLSEDLSEELIESLKAGVASIPAEVGVSINTSTHVITISDSALGEQNVSIDASEAENVSLESSKYRLALADAKAYAPESVAATWGNNDEGALVRYAANSANTAGYQMSSSLDADSNTIVPYIEYIAQKDPEAEATIEGLNSDITPDSLNAVTSGKYVTLNESLLTGAESEVTITLATEGAYEFKLAADATPKSAKETWTATGSASNKTVTYTSASVSSGWNYGNEEDSDTHTIISQHEATGGDVVVISGLVNAAVNSSKTGVPNLSLTTLEGDDGTVNVFTIGSKLLGTVNAVAITANANDELGGNELSNYALSLGAGVTEVDTIANYWSSESVSNNNVTASYYNGDAEGASIAGYILAEDSLSVTYQDTVNPEQADVEIEGLSSKAVAKNYAISGLTVDSDEKVVNITTNVYRGTTAAQAASITSGSGYTYNLGIKANVVLGEGISDASVNGSSGNDIIKNLGSAATISGGKGNDSLVAGTNGDLIDPGMGNDTISLGSGADTVIYTGGNDVIQGYANSSGASISIGEASVKSATFSSNNLKLNIGSGSLTFQSVAGTAVAIGEEDNRRIYYENLVYDSEMHSVTVGSGYTATSLASAYYNDGVSTNVSYLDASGVTKGKNITASGEMTILGSKANDTLYGAGGDSLNGGAGNDTLYGGDGDSLFGGAGNDLFIYQGGNLLIEDYTTKKDRISLGSGISVTDAETTEGGLVLNLSNESSISLNGVGAGVAVSINADGTTKITSTVFDNHLIVNDKKTSGTILSGLDEFDASVSGYSAMVSIDASGLTDALKLTGNAKNNKIFAGSGGSTMDGGKGNDTLYGGEGADVFVYKVGEGKDSLVNFDTANDQVSILTADGEEAADISVIAGASFNRNNLVLTVGKQQITIDGTENFDSATGVAININENTYNFKANQISQGDSTTLYSAFKGSLTADSFTNVDGSLAANALKITGSDSSSTIYGGKKGDTIIGGANADVIDGGDGNDSIYGGGGDDTLKGGNGKDTFVFKASDTGTATITDYTSNQDKIYFSEDADVTYTIKGSSIEFEYGGETITLEDAYGTNKKITTVNYKNKTTTQLTTKLGNDGDSGTLYTASTTSSKTFELFEDNNFITDDLSLDSITDSKYSVTQIQDTKDELTSLTQDYLAYSDDNKK